MKEKKEINKLSLTVVALLILVVGISFAYLAAQISGGSIGNVNVTAEKTDNFSFEVTKDISLTMNQFNFASGSGNLSDSAIARAKLLANSTTNSATYNYYVYFEITDNNFIYTTSDSKPEIVLSITDPTGAEVTSVEGLNYVTATNADGTTVDGFDITTKNGLFNIASLYEITSSSSTNATIQDWIFTVTLINLATNQVDNEGKTLNAEVIIQKDKIKNVYVAANNVPLTVGAEASLNCDSGTTSWNQQYNRIEVSQVNAKYTTCNLSFTQRSSKTYFNDYIIGLSGTTQGTGEVVHEIVNIPDYTDATTLTQSQYGSYSAYYEYTYTSKSGSTVSDVFTFDGTNWSTTSSAMTSNTYYHFQFTAPEDGYYNFCYTMSSGGGNNRLYLYVNGSYIINYISASSFAEMSGCQNTGYVTSGTTIRVVQRAFTPIGTISFNFQKANTVNSYEAGYRYEGQNPNNYVWFNNELWRVIGVFDSTSHGVSDTNLIKIIKINPIGGLAWDKLNTNDWTAASLMNLLNGAYYNQEDGTNGDYCYGYSTTAKAKCDYTNIGISSTYRSMIKNVTWYLGGLSTSSSAANYYKTTVDNYYIYERGDTVYSGRPTNTTGNIGLMYASDYGYAALASSCARTTNLDAYNTAACTLANWLFGNGYEWTITPFSSNSDRVFFVFDGFYSIYDYETTANSFAVRPVLYLDSSVYVIDGSGTESDPYIIGM